MATRRGFGLSWRAAAWVLLPAVGIAPAVAQVKKPADKKPAVPADKKPATAPTPPARKPPLPPPTTPATGGNRQPNVIQSEQLQAKAEELQGQEKWTEAAKTLQQAAELVPDDWAVWDKAGWAYLDADDPAKAVPMFQNAVKNRPAGTAFPGGLLIAQYGVGNKAEVEATLKQVADTDTAAAAGPIITKGLAAKQFSPDWNYGLGWLYSRVLHSSGRAVGPLEAVAKADGVRAEVWLLLVEVNRDLERGPQEDAAAVKYLTLAPDTLDAFRLKAERYVAQQDFPSAINEYKNGIAKYPVGDALYFQLARVYERQGQSKLAADTYQKLITAAQGQKKDALAFLAGTQLANFQARTRNYVEAEKFYREAAARPDAPAITLDNWGFLLAMTNKWEEAGKALDSAVPRAEKPAAGMPAAPDDLLQFRYRAALAHLAAGQRGEARTQLETIAADKSFSRSGPLVELTAFAAWVGSSKQAGLEYQRGDERWATFVWRSKPEGEGEFEIRGRNALADTFRRAALQQIQKRYPDCWPADYALARAYSTGGYTNDALNLLSKSLRTHSDWWAPWFAIGQYYARLKDKEKGVPALEKAVELAPDCRAARVSLNLLNSIKDSDDF